MIGEGIHIVVRPDQLLVSLDPSDVVDPTRTSETHYNRTWSSRQARCMTSSESCCHCGGHTIE